LGGAIPPLNLGEIDMKYQVKELKAIGLDCKRSSKDKRFIVAQTKGKYYPITKEIWNRASRKKGGIEKNIKDIFEGAYALIDVFSVPRSRPLNHKELPKKETEEETEEEWCKQEGNYTTDEMNGEEITR